MALPVELPPPLLEAIVEGARYGHDIAARSHVEEEGWDATTFGVNRYRLSWHWIGVYAGGVPDVGVTYPDQCLRLRWDRFELGFYNGGSGPDWDIRAFDFAATARRAEVGVLNQPTLPGMEVVPADLQHLLIVYAGSPANGCEAVYLGAPITESSSGQTSWAWVEQVWRFDPDRPGVRQRDSDAFVGFRDLEAPEIKVGLREQRAAPAAS
jgi:hypothetical protein